MRNYDVILFDLDGTLTDSAPGILNSVRYACRKLGLPIPGEETLRRFLGPPLIASFRELMGLDAADADRAVSAFREYFPTKGLFENEVYPGVPALLADLKAAGKTVILATSKPEAFARRIMEHFDLARYCDFICGATLDETRTDKAEVIAYALETAGITDKTGLVMVATASMMCWVPKRTACLHRCCLRLRHSRGADRRRGRRSGRHSGRAAQAAAGINQMGDSLRCLPFFIGPGRCNRDTTRGSRTRCRERPASAA